VPVESSHADGLFEECGGEENAWLWDYMLGGPFIDEEGFQTHIDNCANSKDPFFWTILDKTNQPVGLCAYLRVDPKNKSIEIGHLLYSKKLQRTIAATECQYLMASQAFELLGYRRYEWKCNNLNAASKRAAERLGFKFEGVFRQHLIIKGRNRDTSWYSILDSEWPTVKHTYQSWLDLSNFDDNGSQIKRLEEFIPRAA
jgi:RimJ/RimL family protein N-acetyltransferase